IAHLQGEFLGDPITKSQSLREEIPRIQEIHRNVGGNAAQNVQQNKAVSLKGGCDEHRQARIAVGSKLPANHLRRHQLMWLVIHRLSLPALNGSKKTHRPWHRPGHAPGPDRFKRLTAQQHLYTRQRLGEYLPIPSSSRSEEHTSELQSRENLV